MATPRWVHSIGIRAGAQALLLIAAAPLSSAADQAARLVEQQQERAWVQREMQGPQAPGVLPPARLEGSAVADAARADRRWRGVLSSQQFETHGPDRLPGASVRALAHDRQQRAEDLAERVLGRSQELLQPQGR